MLEEDIKMLEALAETTPAALHSPKRNTIIEYKKLAASLVGENYKDGRFTSKIKRIFKFYISFI